MTPQQLAEDLERKNLAYQQAFDAMQTAGVPGAAAAKSVVDSKAEGALGAMEAVSPGAGLVRRAAFGGAGKPAAPPVEKPEEKTRSESVLTEDAAEEEPKKDYFLDLLLRNDQVRLRNKEAFDRREKADSARLKIAAVTDALASLGNLAGVSAGAKNQDQTYQTSVVYQDIEKNRERARTLADYLDRSDQTIRLTQAKQDYEMGLYGNRLALEQAKTDRAMALALERARLASQNAEAKEHLEGTKHGYRSEEETQKQAGRVEIQGMRNEQSDINNRRSTGTSAANNIRTNERIERTGGGGGGSVGGYTTEESTEYDNMGRVVRKTKTRTGSNGQTATTTQGGTHGSQSGSGVSATPPSRRKKDNSKKPPSRR